MIHTVDGSEILHQLIDSSSHYIIFTWFYASQVVIAGFLNHQQYLLKKNLHVIPPWLPRVTIKPQPGLVGSASSGKSQLHVS